MEMERTTENGFWKLLAINRRDEKSWRLIARLIAVTDATRRERSSENPELKQMDMDSRIRE